MLKGLGNQRLSRSTVVKAQLAAIKKRMNQLQENTIHQDLSRAHWAKLQAEQSTLPTLLSTSLIPQIHLLQSIRGLDPHKIPLWIKKISLKETASELRRKERAGNNS